LILFLITGCFCLIQKYIINSLKTWFFFSAIKFCLAIALLILIRGGTPRYRYDYLTKLG